MSAPLVRFWDHLCFYGVPQIGLALLLTMPPFAWRRGWLAGLPDWGLLALAGLDVAGITGGFLVAISAKRAEMRQLQAESFHIPFRPQIVVEEFQRPEEHPWQNS